MQKINSLISVNHGKKIKRDRRRWSKKRNERVERR